MCVGTWHTHIALRNCKLSFDCTLPPRQRKTQPPLQHSKVYVASINIYLMPNVQSYIITTDLLLIQQNHTHASEADYYVILHETKLNMHYKYLLYCLRRFSNYRADHSLEQRNSKTTGFSVGFRRIRI